MLNLLVDRYLDFLSNTLVLNSHLDVVDAILGFVIPLLPIQSILVTIEKRFCRLWVSWCGI